MKLNNYVSSGLANTSLPMNFMWQSLICTEKLGCRGHCNLETTCTKFLLLGLWVLLIRIHVAFIISPALTQEQEYTRLPIN